MTSTTRRGAMMLSAAAVAATTAAAEAAPAQVAIGPIAPYRASCVQTRVLPTFGKDGAFHKEALTANVARICAAIDRGAAEVDARLYVFSEFCLQLSTAPMTPRDWVAGAIRIPGPETDLIAAAARRANAYVAINPVEFIPAFPGRYFLSGVIIAPSGEIVVNYRKLYDQSDKTRPSDVLKRWIDTFGAKSLFPVADTPIGRLGATVALDVNWPEMTRSLMFAGAEVIVNPTASPLVVPMYTPLRAPGAPDEHDPIVPTMVRRVRAFENMTYLLTCNLGPVGPDESAPLQAMQASEIVDFRGRVLAASADSAERFVTATLDVEALRQARCAPDRLNSLSQLQVQLHAPGYAAARFAGLDRFETTPIQSSQEHGVLQRADIADLVRRGVFKGPAGS